MFCSQVQKREYVQIYITGFSCKPFSTLHHQSKLLGEPQARRVSRPLCQIKQSHQRILPSAMVSRWSAYGTSRPARAAAYAYETHSTTVPRGTARYDNDAQQDGILGAFDPDSCQLRVVTLSGRTWQ